jgi:RNA:NAD 2'-phosphotransferase (TPT1/KptA family)
MLNTSVTQTVELSTKFYEFRTMTVLRARYGWRRTTSEVLILDSGATEDEVLHTTNQPTN